MSLRTDMKRDLDKMVSKVADKLLTYCKDNCPVDTGRLQSSLEKSKVKSGEYAVGSETSYAAFVEHGTVKMTPRKFMGKSVEEVVRENV